MSDSLFTKAISGDRRALARAMTRIDDGATDALDAVAALSPRRAVSPGAPFVLGVTGPPGAGKSTFTNRLVARARAHGERVAVLAVDPSSPFSGGAILGDRLRMEAHASDSGVFIRSLSSRGHLGGLSRATGQVVNLLDAAGFDRVILETVGVGQSELSVMGLADTVLVVLTPESGDVVQTMKAGLLEVADVFAVNKADRPGADGLRRNLELMVHLGMPEGAREDHWTIPVHTCSALNDHGVDEVVSACSGHLDWIRAGGRDAWNERRAEGRMRALLGCRCLECSAPRGGVRARLGAEDAIRSGSVNAHAAAAGWSESSWWPLVSAVTGGRGGVRLEREGQLARMVLSNPGARRCNEPADDGGLSGHRDDLMADPPVALIVVGGGADGFCAGGDLRDVRAHLMDDGSAEAMSSAMGRATAQLAASPMVIVSAVEGAALGGGAELSQLADWVVMAESARIGFVHARLGVSPGWGGASLLFRRVGRSAAAAILLRAEVHMRGVRVDAWAGRSGGR